MAQPLPPASIEAQIQGEISGQVAIGNNIIQIGAIHGGVVNVVLPEQQPRPQPRPTPVFLRPRPFPALLDREAEVSTATAAFQSATPMEFHGQAGLGKTTLLRHLSHHPTATSFPDGIICLSARHQPADDLLQSLFDAFYESDRPFKPTDVQVRHALQDKQALILLDDVELPRDEVETLMDTAPGCAFLLASPERRLWGEGRAVALHGLPPDDAQALVERELGRPLTSEERTAAQALCIALDGHPLCLLQAAAMAREKGRSLAEVARQTQPPSPAEALTTAALNSLQEPERQVLAALAALGGAPLPTEHLAALTGLSDIVPILETLLRRGLVQTHSPRYSLAGALGEHLQQMWDLTPWAERALAYFTAWAERHRSAPDRLLEEADAILQTLKWAAGAGRWKEVLRLGRTVEGTLALARRWGAWAQALEWMLQAARALADQAAEAWALHQLGSRALCLDRAEEARASLSQALRMREAIGDRAGAAVTRHNLNLLVGAPPAPPRKPPAPKAGLSPAAWLTLAAGTVIAASLLVGIGIVILTPTPPPPPPPPTSTRTPPLPLQPRVDILLEDGCDREYNYGDESRLFVEANVEGHAELRLDDELIEKIWLTPGEPWHRFWTFEDIEPGEHQVWVVLSDESSEFLAEKGCPFALRKEPSETAEVSVWLAEGCDREYRPGFPTQILFWSSVDSGVSVRLDDQELFGRDVLRGQTYEQNWEVVEEPGQHRLTAVLDSGVSAECWFSVEWPTLTITPSPTSQPIINFWADTTTVQAGFCTTIHWETANVQAVLFNRRRAADMDTHQTCPCNSESHTLDVLLHDGTHDIRTLTINVTGSCVTPTPTPDTKGPDISGLKPSEEELDNHCTYCDPPCKTDVYANVVDPSGVAAVKLVYRKPGETTWITSGMTNVGGASYKTTVNAEGWNSGTLKFYVQARDNYGNVSESGYLTMEVQYCLY